LHYSSHSLIIWRIKPYGMYQVKPEMIQNFFYNKMSLVWQAGIQIHNRAAYWLEEII